MSKQLDKGPAILGALLGAVLVVAMLLPTVSDASGSVGGWFPTDCTVCNRQGSDACPNGDWFTCSPIWGTIQVCVLEVPYVKTCSPQGPAPCYGTAPECSTYHGICS